MHITDINIHSTHKDQSRATEFLRRCQNEEFAKNSNSKIVILSAEFTHVQQRRCLHTVLDVSSNLKNKIS